MGNKRHQALWKACKLLPQDYTPYGKEERWADPNKTYPDCSCGCRYYESLLDPTLSPPYEDHELSLAWPGGADYDWGVCTNPKSHRCGLLTWEHQGCFQFQAQVKIAKPAVPSGLTKTQTDKLRATFKASRKVQIARDIKERGRP